MSTEHPILFSTPMVRAIIGGQKTVTRRAIRGVSPGADRPLAMCGAVSFSDTGRWITCPYGAPGDRLWVRETWRYESDGVAMYRADVADHLVALLELAEHLERLDADAPGIFLQPAAVESGHDATACGATRRV